jgi:hypothetical protein
MPDGIAAKLEWELFAAPSDSPAADNEADEESGCRDSSEDRPGIVPDVFVGDVRGCTGLALDGVARIIESGSGLAQLPCELRPRRTEPFRGGTRHFLQQAFGIADDELEILH